MRRRNLKNKDLTPSFYFNNTERKRLGLFDKDNRDEDKVRITKLDEIFNYADRLRATIKRYESPKSSATEAIRNTAANE